MSKEIERLKSKTKFIKLIINIYDYMNFNYKSTIFDKK